MTSGAMSLTRRRPMSERIIETLLLLATVLGVVTTAGIVLVLAVQNSVPPRHLGTATSATQFFRSIGGTVGIAIFGAIINAVKSDSKSNILSTPSIMTLDNQEARILVGQEIPITTGEALSPNFDNQFRTVDRENVWITLEVIPQFNAVGTINDVRAATNDCGHDQRRDGSAAVRRSSATGSRSTSSPTTCRSSAACSPGPTATCWSSCSHRSWCTRRTPTAGSSRWPRGA